MIKKILKNKNLFYFFVLGLFLFIPNLVFAGAIKQFFGELTIIIGSTLLIALGGLVFVGFSINVIKMIRSVDGKDTAELKTKLAWNIGLLMLLVALFGIIGMFQDWFGFANYFGGVKTGDETFLKKPQVQTPAPVSSTPPPVTNPNSPTKNTGTSIGTGGGGTGTGTDGKGSKTGTGGKSGTTNTTKTDNTTKGGTSTSTTKP